MENTIVPVESGVMENLVKVENNQVVVSSRQIAEHFGKQHKDVLENIRKILVAENSATKFFSETVHEYRGQQFPEYLMDRDGFSLLVMGFTGKQALEWKLKYINAFNKMENQLKSILPNFNNPAEAARAWANEYEAKQKALAQVAMMKPKAEYFDCLVDRNLLTNFRTTAKELGIKRNQFINWLLENNFVYRDNHNKLMPYAQYEEYFCIKDSKSPSNKWAGTQTLITPKGKEAFRLLIGVTKND